MYHINITLPTQCHCKHSSNSWHRYLWVQQAQGTGLLCMQFEKGREGFVESALQSTSCPAPGRALCISRLSKLRGFEAAPCFLAVCPPQLQSTFSCSLAIHGLHSAKRNQEKKARKKQRPWLCTEADRKGSAGERNLHKSTQQIPRNALTSDTICNARSTAVPTAPYSKTGTSKSAPLPCSTRSAKHRNQTQKL